MIIINRIVPIFGLIPCFEFDLFAARLDFMELEAVEVFCLDLASKITFE